ncbi:MAG: hypothetical protein WD269_09400 [Acidimicrobiia bacterium]
MLVLSDLHKAFGEGRALDASSFTVGRGGLLRFGRRTGWREAWRGGVE